MSRYHFGFRSKCLKTFLELNPIHAASFPPHEIPHYGKICPKRLGTTSNIENILHKLSRLHHPLVLLSIGALARGSLNGGVDHAQSSTQALRVDEVYLAPGQDGAYTVRKIPGDTRDVE